MMGLTCEMVGLDVTEVLVLGPVGEAHLHGALVQRRELLGLQESAGQLLSPCFSVQICASESQ